MKCKHENCPKEATKGKFCSDHAPNNSEEKKTLGVASGGGSRGLFAEKFICMDKLRP